MLVANRNAGIPNNIPRLTKRQWGIVFFVMTF